MTQMRNDGYIFAKNEARTPPNLFQKLNDEFHFDCDAAANEHNSLCGDNWLQNALEDSWVAFGWAAFFCNPPYSNGNILKFVHKSHHESLNGASVALLIPADTSTHYFSYCFYNAHEIRFLQPRVKFNNPDGTPMKGSPTWGSMAVIFRPGCNHGTASVKLWKWKE